MSSKLLETKEKITLWTNGHISIGCRGSEPWECAADTLEETEEWFEALTTYLYEFHSH